MAAVPVHLHPPSCFPAAVLVLRQQVATFWPWRVHCSEYISAQARGTCSSHTHAKENGKHLQTSKEMYSHGCTGNHSHIQTDTHTHDYTNTHTRMHAHIHAQIHLPTHIHHFAALSGQISVWQERGFDWVNSNSSRAMHALLLTWLCFRWSLSSKCNWQHPTEMGFEFIFKISLTHIEMLYFVYKNIPVDEREIKQLCIILWKCDMKHFEAMWELFIYLLQINLNHIWNI